MWGGGTASPNPPWEFAHAGFARFLLAHAVRGAGGRDRARTAPTVGELKSHGGAEGWFSFIKPIEFTHFLGT